MIKLAKSLKFFYLFLLCLVLLSCGVSQRDIHEINESAKKLSDTAERMADVAESIDASFKKVTSFLEATILKDLDQLVDQLETNKGQPPNLAEEDDFDSNNFFEPPSQNPLEPL